MLISLNSLVKEKQIIHTFNYFLIQDTKTMLSAFECTQVYTERLNS